MNRIVEIIERAEIAVMEAFIEILSASKAVWTLPHKPYAATLRRCPRDPNVKVTHRSERT